MRLDGFDMNLLKVFRALWTERSVSRAAASLNLSQSATSAALSRLRIAFKDDLFIWDGRTMRTTPHAEEVSAAVQKVLTETQFLLDEADQHLAGATRAFVIASYDHIERMIGPPLLARLRKNAPNLTINLMNATYSMIGGSGARVVDLFILPEGVIPQSCAKPQLLYKDRYVALVSRAACEGRLPEHATVDDLPEDLCFVPGAGRAGHVGGKGRRPSRFTSTHFDVISAYSSSKDSVTIVPRHVAQALRDRSDIRVVEFPDPAPVSEVLMHWRPMYERDPFHQWLRGTIQELATDIQQQIDGQQDR